MPANSTSYVDNPDYQFFLFLIFSFLLKII